MKTFIVLLLSTFIFSGCQFKSDVKNKVLNEVEEKVDQVDQRIDQKITEERLEDVPVSPDPDDQQLLDQLDSDNDSDSGFADLEEQFN